MPDLHEKLYTTLFTRVEDAIAYIHSDMILKEIFDWDHTRELLLMLQAALQECEDIYADADTAAE